MATTETVTILFCDLVASTQRRARLGDDAFDAFTIRFMSALRASIATWGGHEASSAGDGLMVVFRASVADAVECASEMHHVVAALDADDPPLLRIGISTGEVAQDGREFSGMPIVEAARLEAAAAPGQTLANAVVRTLVGNRRGLRFRDIGALSLKGIPEPLAAVAIIDTDTSDAPGTPHPMAVVPPGDAPRRNVRAMAGAAVLIVFIAAIGAAVAWRSGSGDDSKTAGHASAPAGVPKPTGYTPTYASTSCPADVKQEAANAKCGTLVVPQDRRKPDGPRVSLLVTRAPARLAGPAVAPTIDICECENLGNSLARDHSDLIRVGRRGYAGTPSLACPEFVDARVVARTKRSDDAAVNANISSQLRRCHDRLVREGFDPAQYNFESAAADVLDLMWLQQIRQANLVALGDLGIEAFAILRTAPGAIRSLTLENPSPAGVTRFTDPTGNLADAFRRLDAQCRADRACKTAYPSLESTFTASYRAYQAKPQLVSTPDPDDPHAPPIQILLDGPRIADALADGLQQTSVLGSIPSAVMDANSELLASVVVGDDRLVDDAPWGAQASYYCSYLVHTEDEVLQALAAKRLPEFVRAHDTHWSEWCKGWNVPDRSATLGSDIVSNVPLLAFRGDATPDGNSGWLPKIERGFSAMHSAIFPTLGKGLLDNGPPCLSTIRRDFLADPTAPVDTAACVKQSPPIAFVTPTG